ncbi:MAG: acyl-CoA dehydrogenase [Candidatus Cloacimonetes bacterium 4572_55]|nr:MAG: acyl-CoA dehydrogenase [Candidatus Cloacimonetes bacterium 4572_55]
MESLLSKENVEWREKTRAIAEEYVRPVAAELDRTGEYPWKVMEVLRENGITGLWVPKEYGGQNAGSLNLCIVVEELSRTCGGVGVSYAVNALGTLPILMGGTEAQKKKYLPMVSTGEKYASFCLSEKEAGSDAGSLKTTARKENADYIINGDKKWTTNGGVASIFSVFATTNPDRGTRGISAFLIERDEEGFEVGKREDLMGIRCVPVNETHFRNCRIPADRLIGGRENSGFKHAMMTLDRGRPGVAAQAVGLAQGAFELALNYARKREQFGQPIINNQAIQFLFADMGTRIEAARGLVYHAARSVDAGTKDASKLAAMCKVFATDTAMWVTTEAVQVFGGYGYCRDYPIEKYMRDAKITQIYEGTNQIQRLVIGRSILREATATDK